MTAAVISKEQVKVIHVVKSMLGLDDIAYRAILWGAARVSTSKDLTWHGYYAVMDRFKEIGKERGMKVFISLKARPGKKMRPYQEPKKGVWLSRNKQAAIYGLWEDVARDKSPQALMAFIKRMTGVDNIRFLDDGQGDKVIEALKQMKRRQDPGWSGRLGDHT